MASQHDAKRFATAQALAALHGVTLHRLDGDFGRPLFVATKWALTKQLDTLVLTLITNLVAKSRSLVDCAKKQRSNEKSDCNAIAFPLGGFLGGLWKKPS